MEVIEIPQADGDLQLLSRHDGNLEDFEDPIALQKGLRNRKSPQRLTYK